MTRVCPRCRSIQSVRISTNTTYTIVKKGKNKGKEKKVLITVYHCEGCNSFLGSETRESLELESFIADQDKEYNIASDMPIAKLTRVKDFLPKPKKLFELKENKLKGSKKEKRVAKILKKPRDRMKKITGFQP